MIKDSLLEIVNFQFEKKHKNIGIYGQNLTTRALEIYKEYKNSSKTTIVLSQSKAEAEELFSILNDFENETYLYPEIDIEDILVIYDDLDTKTANFKLKAKGSSGGHNGIKSIISHLGTEKFNRLKIGIDRPTPPMKVVDYVLGRFSKDEMTEIEKIYSKSINCIEDFSKMSFVDLMNKYN